MQVIQIPAFNDNYIWLIKASNSQQCIVVDPGDAQPVLERIKSLELELCGVLLTHHHNDHHGGIPRLLEEYPQAKVYGLTKPQYSFDCESISELEQIEVIGLKFDVLHFSGHTVDHIGFMIENNLFCGDTLFSAGCGRLLGGSAKQLFESLKIISALPSHTRIYCAHEYTLDNLRFAHKIEPHNPDLTAYIARVSKLRHQGLPTIPSTLDLELKVNPFLRTDSPELQATVQMHCKRAINDELEFFTELRRWKDDF
ncbi:hydroxyacylglutathione hydrolase [Alginatibacterium sediminis]|uniref:Hydroxyacylglutathione hydrolase n=1 Tax=Alginatibacterium sediminis TaxID=2164068 RepID=A0A420E9L0_9ALTE|nr:hydroxyacylglutathione hydrolase [Alginatibacterium sediminis]RKF17377.1 hydroxyacylglutathione hydrolase [Alginatibacterium sediminis]